MRESVSFGLAIEQSSFISTRICQKRGLHSASIPTVDVKGRILLFHEWTSTLPAEVGLADSAKIDISIL